MSFVIQQIHRPGKTARADETGAFALVQGAINDDVVYRMYLALSDPDGNGGLGSDLWTSHIDQAQKFASHEAAFECWRAQSTVVPMRPDGKPNRPMTAYSVTIAEVL